MLAAPMPARSQHATDASTAAWGAYGIGMFSRVEPTPAGGADSEAYLTQPMLLMHVSLPRWRAGLKATLNLEGLTLAGGELAPGNTGEGFVDKRHPHTYLHEVMATFQAGLGPVHASIASGRGVAPFGTDDPMVRPFVRYPTNHHWSQILERWTLIGAVRAGPITAEAGLFNGNEPERPGDVGGFDRFGDSWAARLTLRTVHNIELQGSYASVASPEFREGFGLDQRKWSGSARFEHLFDQGLALYSFVEVAQTDEYADERKAFVFTSVLAETAVRPGSWLLALRYERTTRPEEERERDLYRSPRPHSDENIIGATRWNTVTAHAGRSFSFGRIDLEPFAELSRSGVAEVAGGIFDPLAFYGDTELWSISVGFRVRTGLQHIRMGRYGVAASDHDDGRATANPGSMRHD